MLKWTYACLALAVMTIMTAPGAAASEVQAAALVEIAPAPDWVPESCARIARARGHRINFGEPRLCREPASVARGCEMQVDIRAASLRYASGRRRHGHVNTCL